MLKNNKIMKYFRSHTIFFHIISVILWLWTLALAFLFVYGIVISLMDGFEYSLNPSGMKMQFKFSNYIEAFKSIEYSVMGRTITFFKMFCNTIWYSAGVTILRLVATALAAYCVAKVKFKGRLIIYYIVLFQMMLPTYGSEVSYMMWIRQLGMYDSPLYLLANFAGHGSWFLLMYSCFKGVPDTYAESAKIDGANEFQVFFRVMLPFGKGIMVAMFIMLFMSTWGDYATPLLYLPSYPTLSTGLFRYKTLAGYTLDIPIYFAGLLFTSIPVVVVFLIFHKTLMENKTLGGLKG